MKTIGIRTQKRAKINLVSSGRYKFLSTKKVLYSNSPIIISKTLSKASSTLPNGSWNKEKICPNHRSEARIRHSSDGLPGNQKSGYNFRSDLGPRTRQGICLTYINLTISAHHRDRSSSHLYKSLEFVCNKQFKPPYVCDVSCIYQKVNPVREQ